MEPGCRQEFPAASPLCLQPVVHPRPRLTLPRAATAAVHSWLSARPHHSRAAGWRIHAPRHRMSMPTPASCRKSSAPRARPVQPENLRQSDHQRAVRPRRERTPAAPPRAIRATLRIAAARATLRSPTSLHRWRGRQSLPRSVATMSGDSGANVLRVLLRGQATSSRGVPEPGMGALSKEAKSSREAASSREATSSKEAKSSREATSSREAQQPTDAERHRAIRPQRTRGGPVRCGGVRCSLHRFPGAQ